MQLTIDRETHDKLRKVQDLLRHVVPDGDLAVIFDRALTLLLQDLERRKFARVERPRDGAISGGAGRHVPATVRRRVWARDGGQCAFVGADGRCAERGFLEFHHVVPFAGSGSTTVDNLQLRCRAHNAYEAREYFGPPLLRERSISYELGPARVHDWHMAAPFCEANRYCASLQPADMLTQDIGAEQGRWNDFNPLLEELERALAHR